MCEVYGNVSVCVPSHSVTCSMFFKPAGPCKKRELEKINAPPQISKLLTTKLFPLPGVSHYNLSVGANSGR